MERENMEFSLFSADLPIAFYSSFRYNAYTKHIFFLVEVLRTSDAFIQIMAVLPSDLCS